ncbi:MAG: redoxin domain-containing protein [Firmicutes bacterium]|nr:redoxin domain-containing protein [Bacillota bacterium]
MNIYDFTVKKQDGTEQSLRDFEGKVLLVVNTATGCGFTPQYKELEEYYEEFRDQGFEILDFPCNQFAGQAPGTDEEIHQFCALKYDTQFPQFSKIEVNGEGERHVSPTPCCDECVTSPRSRVTVRSIRRSRRLRSQP